MEPQTPTNDSNNHEVESFNELNSGTMSKPSIDDSMSAINDNKFADPVFDSLKGFIIEPTSNRVSKQKHPHRSRSFQIRPLTPIKNLDYDVFKNPSKANQEKKFELWNFHGVRFSPQLNYETTLLAHAKFYIMVNCFLLTKLKNLTLQQLQIRLIALDNPSSDSQMMFNITILIQYVYANTVRRKKKKKSMRKLITIYVAFQFTALRKNEFMQLLIKGGDIVDDVLTKLKRRIASYEAKTESQKKNFASE